MTANQPFFPKLVGNRSVPYLVLPEGRNELSQPDYFVYAAVQHQDVMGKGTWPRVWQTAVPDSFGDRIGLPWTSATNRSASWGRLFGAGLLQGDQGAFTVVKTSLFGRLPLAFFHYSSSQAEVLTPNELRALGWLATRTNASGICNTTAEQLGQQLDLGATTTSTIRRELERKGALKLLGPQQIQLLSFQQLNLYNVALDSFQTLCQFLVGSGSSPVAPSVTGPAPAAQLSSAPSPAPAVQPQTSPNPLGATAAKPQPSHGQAVPSPTPTAQPQQTRSKAVRNANRKGSKRELDSVDVIRSTGPRPEPIKPDWSPQIVADRGSDLMPENSPTSRVKAAYTISQEVWEEHSTYLNEFSGYCSDMVICGHMTPADRDIAKKIVSAKRNEVTDYMTRFVDMELLKAADDTATFDEAFQLLSKSEEILDRSKWGLPYLIGKVKPALIPTLTKLDAAAIESFFQKVRATNTSFDEEQMVKGLIYNLSQESATVLGVFELERDGAIPHAHAAFIVHALGRRKERIQRAIDTWYGQDVDWSIADNLLPLIPGRPQPQQSEFMALKLPFKPKPR